MSVSGPENRGKRLPWPVRILQCGIAVLALAVLIYLATVEMSWQQQAVLALVLLLLSFWLDRSSKSHVITLTLMGMSLFATCRYGYWRLHMVGVFFTDSRSRWGSLDACFILMLVGAEVYSFVILTLGYLQTAWPLHRMPAPLPADLAAWPEIDLLIPTYNEPLSVVRYTVLAALNIDWPPEKLHVFLLDDGKREDFRAFAEAANVGYMTRTDNQGAKAGNINSALDRTHSPYVAIFDCDHVPTRSFLQVTVGWFLRDQKLGLLQTPHHFYSPDPFERNLKQFHTIPNEGELFYGIVQDGNDFWNATFFCGSCAVLRRTALAEIGGIATQTVTEDAHTSLRIQKKGWNTAYINIPQAAGLATESLSGHVRQRVRWARGMVQILRQDNPLFARGLSLPQRLCYFNAMMHFMYALPRLIFLTAPLLYLIFSCTNVPGYWAAILAFALPHLVLSSSTNSRIQGQYRHSFWNEIYETVLAPYILLPTILALINPRMGKFNVTAKGGVVKASYFDIRIAYPFIFLLAMNLVGLLMAVPRLVHVPGMAWIWDGTHPGTIAINCAWTSFNIVILSVVMAVAREEQQRRAQVRITLASHISVMLPDGTVAMGDTTDLSSSGVAIRLLQPIQLALGQEVQIVFSLMEGNALLPVVVRGSEERELRLQFSPLSLDEQGILTSVLYSRADSWLGWGESREPDRPLRSLWRIVRLSVTGLAIAVHSVLPAGQRRLDRAALEASRITPLLLTGLLLLGFLVPGKTAARAEQRAQGSAPRQFNDQFTLRDAGVVTPIELGGRVRSRSVNFSLPEMELTQKASLHLYYHLAPTQNAQPASVRVLLNSTEVAILTVPRTVDRASLLEQEIALPAELLVHQNQLTFAYGGQPCPSPADMALWSSIEPETRLVLSGSLLAVPTDLTRLPLPFLDPSSLRRSSVRVVFASPPSPEAMEAAGIVASYFGMLADNHQLLFPVSIGKLPPGNVILIAESAALLPSGLALSGIASPTVAVRPNPSDPASTVLVVTGGGAGQLVIAAQAIALRSPLLKTDTAIIGTLSLPPGRQADDAPRWLRTDRTIALPDSDPSGATPDDGSVPVDVYLRLPPDLDYVNRETVPLTLDYRYDQLPLRGSSAAQVVVNEKYIGSTLLPPGRNGIKIVRSQMALATATLRPFSNSLSMAFAFQFADQRVCQGTTPAGMTAALMTSSRLDLRGVPHWAALPNLELFANAGFPFTQYADLHGTTVVLPARPAASEIALYLMLMGHFAAQTGYPALRVRVADSDALQPGEGRDFLVIGGRDDQEAIGKLSSSLPVSLAGGGVDIEQAGGLFANLQDAGWEIPGFRREDAEANPDHFATMPDAVIAGIESPYAAGHSVVLIVLPNRDSENPWMGAFLSVAQSSAISGGVSVVRGGQFVSYSVRRGVYHVGSLPWPFRFHLWLTQAPWTIPGGVLACCLPLALCTRGWLVRHAATRLNGLKGNSDVE
jgi:cellulose synthase (UDP-forming)